MIESSKSKNSYFQLERDDVVNMQNSSVMKDIHSRVAHHTEQLMLEQLNDFVSRGLIVSESGPMSFINKQDGSVEIRQTVKLVLKDKEYIERLEHRVKHLEERIEMIKSAMTYANDMAFPLDDVKK